MIPPKFSLGANVYLASTRNTTIHETCPDCLGERFLTVIIGGGTQVAVACESCKHGYLGSTGYVDVQKPTACVDEFVVSGIEDDRNGRWEYRSHQHGTVREVDLFDRKEDAEARASELARIDEEARVLRLRSKEKEHKTWAWNVSYHRREVRKLEEQIKYHESKLAVAKKEMEK